MKPLFAVMCVFALPQLPSPIPGVEYLRPDRVAAAADRHARHGRRPAVRRRRAVRRQGHVAAGTRPRSGSVSDGCVTSGGNDIVAEESFGDCQLHVEWATPEKVVGQGQGRGNSGVFMMGLYEVQILDSYDNDTYYDGQAAAIYKQHPPMVNACRKPGEWQTYDILWEGPQFDEKASC